MILHFDVESNMKRVNTVEETTKNGNGGSHIPFYGQRSLKLFVNTSTIGTA